MTAHEPINYLDSILNEEERRCEYSHERRNFTISRSGRFKSKNKKRDTVDRKLFDASSTTSSTATTTTSATAEKMSTTTMVTQQRDDMTNSNWKKGGNSFNNFTNSSFKEPDTMGTRHLQATTSSAKDFKSYQQPQLTTNKRVRDKVTNNYKSFYETNL